MKYSIGQKIHGFVVERSRHIREIGGDLYILRHEHSGAQLCYIDNDDRNMSYSVTFATPSCDSTGVFHILEHSVLCGSEKYPVGDPFVELMKSSLYTFLNALTFPDKTMYPVSSMNEKDLMNLISVYTDAVFRPLIYRDDSAFRQEGWHIERGKDGKPYYQGVVYNEMRGALGDPDETLYQEVFNESYEPCQYTTVSGGYPDDIVGLTYEEFIAAHKKHYHPSNARFYLYGKTELESKLEFLDKEYLSRVEPQEPVREPEIRLRKQTKPLYCTYTADNQKSGEDYIAFSYPIGMVPDFETMLGLSVLTDILADTNYDPLKKRILDKGLAVEVDCELIEDLAYPLFVIRLRHCDASRLSEIDAEITDCLRECAAGLDKEAAEAKLSTEEFSLREGSSSGLTKGLYYGIQIAGAWLYDSDPWIYLEYEEPLKKIKETLEDGFFENLIDKFLLQNNNRVVVVMTPTVTEKKYKEPTEEEAQAAMPIAPEKLPEAPDGGDRIPHLSLSDIDKKAVKLVTEPREQDGVKYLFHPLKTDGIVYAEIYFDVAGADDDELFYLSLMSSLLTNTATSKTDGGTLSTKLGLYTGSMEAGSVIGSYGERVISAVSLRFKALADKYPLALELAEEIRTCSDFSDRKIIIDIINQMFTEARLRLINNSSHTCAVRAAAVRNIRDALSDKTGGVTFYLRLKDLKNSLDSSEEAFSVLEKNLISVFEKYIVNGKAVMSLACDDNSFEKIKDVPIPKALGDILTDELGQASTPLLSGNIALSAPCDIVFNGFSFNTEKDLSGGLLLLAKKILSLEYLWQKIRVENGAYGCGAAANPAKQLDMWSFRDPQVAATFAVYEKAAEFLSGLKLSDRALEDYIISVIRGLDTPVMPRVTARLSDIYRFIGKDHDAVQKERDELLAAQAEDINALGKSLEISIKEKSYCTVGSAELIAANSGLYDEIIKL